jgi:hypothetical protein
MAVASDGTAFVSGSFTGTETFSPTGVNGTKTSAGKNDCYLCKVLPDGSFAWVVSWGGADDDITVDTVTDKNGNCYVLGTFIGTANFDTSGATYEITATGLQDAFILKIDPNGVSKWARTIGGSGEVKPQAITMDLDGCLYLTGSFTNSIDLDPTSGTTQAGSNGESDTFLIKMLPGGNWQ